MWSFFMVSALYAALDYFLCICKKHKLKNYFPWRTAQFIWSTWYFRWFPSLILEVRKHWHVTIHSHHVDTVGMDTSLFSDCRSSFLQPLPHPYSSHILWSPQTCLFLLPSSAKTNLQNVNYTFCKNSVAHLEIRTFIILTCRPAQP